MADGRQYKKQFNMADGHHNEKYISGYNSTTVCLTTMTVERQKFRVLKILSDGGRICTETLQTQMLQTIARVGGLSFQPIEGIRLF